MIDMDEVLKLGSQVSHEREYIIEEGGDNE